MGVHDPAREAAYNRAMRYVDAIIAVNRAYSPDLVVPGKLYDDIVSRIANIELRMNRRAERAAR